MKRIKYYKSTFHGFLTLLLCAIAFVLSACSEDDTFSTSTSNLLTFSTDTVCLDTTFSRMPTTTQTFWVYNRSKDGIRCSNIRLKNGNQTGFRVNVDGVYLGSSSGFQVNDVEIRKGDSIRVFVELTSATQQTEQPKLVTDDLVFTLESGRQQQVNLKAWSWDATLIGKLEVSSDTTIQSTKPIVIREGIKVDSSATLTIAAGTTLYFANKAGIDVYGRLVVNGNAENNVTLRGDRLDNMFDYLPYDRVAGQWQGVHFYTSSYNNQIDYADIHSSYNGIVCDSASTETLKLHLYNSTIHNCQGYGLISTNCYLDLYNCQITNSMNDCAAFFGGRVSLKHCTIAQFFPFDLNQTVGVALRFQNYRNDSLYPLELFGVYNCLITGYNEDEVMGDFKDDAAASYYFSHSILRTIKPDTIQSEFYQDVIWEQASDTTQGGKKHFKTIDYDKQYFDFHLDSLSHAIDSAATLPSPYHETDRDGCLRDVRPDIGCYEFKKK